jgi:hypothetical protein
MLFNWDTNNVCIVFRQWHIRSTASLFFSLFAILLITVGYEALRSVSRRYEESLAKSIQALPSKPTIPSLPLFFLFYFPCRSSPLHTAVSFFREGLGHIRS